MIPFFFFLIDLIWLKNFYNKFKPASQSFYTKKRFQRMLTDGKSFVTYQIKCLLLFYLFQKKLQFIQYIEYQNFLFFTPVDCTLD